ncbi:MarR family winged helix-turn-helix transcriptional regulator [Amycolatopsis nivea]|uniref:MarR family transcriptional regulator n=1 Tax=Amycolatopsis dendrobii TaxID=2760662 RepID=A0A7W3ZDD8_9PSEU|nr:MULTISPECIES: MarR family transcriptional regulator [Amycolatopsis]MBB1156897.1 MarR family transcriptional regulator [Amycolatopsis dendrobii]UKD53600.1 MarR family transcriptional regulator [Amycolatopsis sp. FU40]
MTSPDTGETGSLLLDDQLCFGLYSASRAVTALYRALLEPLDLTYPQYLVMLALWQQDEQQVKELGSALNLDSGTLSPLLKRLEKAGLIKRERQSDDERSVRIRLTDEGTALRAKAERIPPHVGAAMNLDNAELGRMRAAMDQLTASVNAYRESYRPS